MILHKNGNFFPSSYKLIVFENMLAKVLKKHIANIISKAAEKHKLFFQNQMEEKRK